jgi:hypothetical protein
MKWRKEILIVVAVCVLLLVGCAGETKTVGNANVKYESSPADAQNMETVAFADNISTVDYDLTVMNSDMVYATVYQMMMEPEEYEGKIFRMEGSYYTVYSENTKKYYHYCIIRDATACCAQGMEFVWDDGSHVYPDEYPEENADVIVEGTFETYTESGDSNLYCRLKNASMEVE